MCMKFKQTIDSISNKFSDKTKEQIEFYSSLFGLISVIYGVGEISFAIAKEIVPKIDTSKLPWFFCATLMAVLLIMRFKLRQYKKNLWNRKSVVSRNYCKTLNDYKEFYFAILKFHKEKRLYDDILTRIILDHLKKILDNLCEIFKVYTGQEINACIKLISSDENNPSLDNINVENATVYTFVRSSNITAERENSAENGPALLKENTDFYFIISPPDFYKGREYFYEKNLHEFRDKLSKKHNMTYNNTNKNYWDFYRGVIVTPIRISHKNLHFTETENNYHIIGFLCVDTMSTNAFISENKNQFINIINSFASIIYLILNKYKFYLQKCNINGTESVQDNEVQ